MRLLFSGLRLLARRVAITVALGLLPAPAFALMPWSGDGACSAMLSPGLRVADCDFRDYLDPGMPAPAEVPPQAALSPAPLEEGSCRAAANSDTSVAPYDWAASAACGPTDWDCSRSNYCGEPAPVGEAVRAVLGLCPAIPVELWSWETLDAAADTVRPAVEALDLQAETAERSARAAMRASVRSAAGRLGGTLDQVGRQFLGAAAALHRVAEGDDAPVESTAARPMGPQPSMNPYGHLGL